MKRAIGIAALVMLLSGTARATEYEISWCAFIGLSSPAPDSKLTCLRLDDTKYESTIVMKYREGWRLITVASPLQKPNRSDDHTWLVYFERPKK